MDVGRTWCLGPMKLSPMKRPEIGTWWEPERVGRMSEERGKAAASGCLSGRLVGANNRQAFGYSLLPTRA